MVDRDRRVDDLCRMRLRAAILLLPLAAMACAGGPDRKLVLASLVGQPEADAVRQLGVPTRVYETGGRKFIAYDERRTDLLPGTPFLGGYGGFGYFGAGYGGFGGFPPQIIERGCETTLEVAGGRVVSWALRGSACS